MSEERHHAAVTVQAAQVAEAKEELRRLAQRWREQPWWAHLTATGPGPIAHEVRAFADVLDGGDAGGALLQLRDTVETLLKLLALVMARDLIAHGTAADAGAARKALLSRPLTLGSWAAAMREFAQRIETAGPAFLTLPLARIAASRPAQNAINDFVRDRNDEIGHGAFRRDPREAAKVVEKVAFGVHGGAASVFAAFAGAEWPRLELLRGEEHVRTCSSSTRSTTASGADASTSWTTSRGTRCAAATRSWPRHSQRRTKTTPRSKRLSAGASSAGRRSSNLSRPRTIRAMSVPATCARSCRRGSKPARPA